MNILIIGSDSNYQEARLKFGTALKYVHARNHSEAKKSLASMQVVFDFALVNDPHNITLYEDHPTLTVFVDTSKISLMDIAARNKHKIRFPFFGFCGLATFLNRSMLEVSLYEDQHKEKLKEVCGELNTPYGIVADRVGLATPRIVCMIINEAYYTVQEGTATREDIDLAMKLGTNYPYGPFEWASRIGITNVFELLQAVYDDTKDERYKICPLLKKEQLSLSED
jgi:3-hydroxybutyryl-CoA dehydrogenase